MHCPTLETVFWGIFSVHSSQDRVCQRYGKVGIRRRDAPPTYIESEAFSFDVMDSWTTSIEAQVDLDTLYQFGEGRNMWTSEKIG